MASNINIIKMKKTNNKKAVATVVEVQQPIMQQLPAEDTCLREIQCAQSMDPEDQGVIAMIERWEAEEELVKAAEQVAEPIIISSGEMVSQYSCLMFEN